MTDSKQKMIEEIDTIIFNWRMSGNPSRGEIVKQIIAIAARHFQPSNPPSAIELTEMLFEQYAMVDDDTLSKGAQKLKNRLLGMARRAMQKDDRQPITSATESSVSNETDNKPDAAGDGDVEALADKMMEHIPSNLALHMPDDPCSYKWARGIALNCAKVALPRYKDISAGDDDIACENCDAPAKGYSLDDVPLCEECGRRLAEDGANAPRPEPARAGQDAGALLDPDMPAQELRLHCGELTAGEERTGRACIRWANSVRAEHPSVTVADLQPIREALEYCQQRQVFIVEKGISVPELNEHAVGGDEQIRFALAHLTALEARVAKDGGA